MRFVKYILPIIAVAIICTYAYKPVHKYGVFAYLPSATTTTVLTADTFQTIVGAFDNKAMEGFSLQADTTIQYDGHYPNWYEIDWHAATSLNSNGGTVLFAIRHNGTLDSSSIMGTYLKTANEIQALSGTAVVYLSYGDKIQLVLTSNDVADIVNVEHYTTSIRPFYKY